MFLFQYATAGVYNTISGGKNPIPPAYWMPTDKAFGRSYYFIDIDPNQCNVVNLAQTFRNVYLFSKSEYYLKFNVPEDLLIACGPHVYRVNAWDPRIQLLESGRSPQCSRGPCVMCETIPKAKKLFHLS
jgi:hypothetical protein